MGANLVYSTRHPADALREPFSASRTCVKRETAHHSPRRRLPTWEWTKTYQAAVNRKSYRSRIV
jgi:hypothetical protein